LKKRGLGQEDEVLENENDALGVDVEDKKVASLIKKDEKMPD